MNNKTFSSCKEHKKQRSATPLPHIVLASSSPRRRELLQEAGYSFEVVAPTIPEPDEALNGLSPAQQAEALAYFKARAVADQRPDSYVLGADTIVALGDRILGKPDDADQARFMLQSLSGTRQMVITGMALLAPQSRRIIASEVTYVTMRHMTEQEIQQYIDSNEWMGKAGAYAIQETADRFVTNVEGSFSNVVGLPLELLEKMLIQMR